MDKHTWENKLKEGIDKISKEIDYNPYIGPIGKEGLYQIGNGCFTGKEGYENFIKVLNDETK